MKSEESMMDGIIAEAKRMYRKMSLTELLAEENMVTEFLNRSKVGSAHFRIQKILRSEIECRLR